MNTLSIDRYSTGLYSFKGSIAEAHAIPAAFTYSLNDNDVSARVITAGKINVSDGQYVRAKH